LLLTAVEDVDHRIAGPVGLIAVRQQHVQLAVLAHDRRAQHEALAHGLRRLPGLERQGCGEQRHHQGEGGAADHGAASRSAGWIRSQALPYRSSNTATTPEGSRRGVSRKTTPAAMKAAWSRAKSSVPRNS